MNIAGMTKKERYDYAHTCLNGLVDSEGGGAIDQIALMATVCSLVKSLQPHAYWVGFYRNMGDGILMVGPYQGTPGCLQIQFGKGVCGTAALTEKTVIVPDVHAFPGHIACDAASRSEIVLPVFDCRGKLIAVLDLDSTEPEAFDQVDEHGLCALLAVFKR